VNAQFPDLVGNLEKRIKYLLHKSSAILVSMLDVVATGTPKTKAVI
jgi:hypothetical protein